MERFLLLWDDLDDWTHACRHVVSSAASEVADLAAPVATAFVTGLATFWGAARDLFP